MFTLTSPLRCSSSSGHMQLDPSTTEPVLSWQLHKRFPRLQHIEFRNPSEVDAFTDATFANLVLKVTVCTTINR